MKTLLGFLRLLAFVAMALLLSELKSHYISSYISNQLRQNGISFDLEINSLTDITLRKIIYKGVYIADRLHLVYELAPLLDMRIVIDLVQIDGLRLKAIEKIAKESPRSKSSGSSWQFLIKKAQIDGIYPYKGTNKITLHAKNITKEQATITRLLLRTFAGSLKAKGTYAQGTLHLRGFADPRPIQKIYLSKATFDLNATTKEAKISLSMPRARYQDLNLTQIQILAKSDYHKVQSQIHTILYHPDLNASVQGRLTYDKELRYSASAALTIKKRPIPIRYQSYKNFTLQILGDQNGLDYNLTNPYLKASGDLEFQTKRFSLRTSKVLVKDLYPKIPVQDMDLALEAKGRFEKFEYKASSNYLQAQGLYEHNTTKATLRFLRPIKELNLPALNPLTLFASPGKIDIKSSMLTAHITPNQSIITLPHAKIWAQKEKELLKLRSSIESLKKFTNALNKLYPLPPIQNDLPLNVEAKVDLKSKEYQAHIFTPPANKALFDYLELRLRGNETKLFIDYYALVIAGRGLYATKTSTLEWDKKSLRLDLWIEDKARLTGSYHLKNKEGALSLTAKAYRYSGPEADIKTDIDIQITIKDQKIQADGEVKLLGGVIAYEPKRGRVVEDEDIIVIDKQIQTQQESFFKKNVALSIHIEAKRPILYKIPDLYVLVRPDLLIYKEYDKDLELLGLVKILKGRYEIADGYFDITPSQLSFYGPPNNPLLDLHLKTRKDRYIIYITVSGDAQNPILSFDSDPYLKPNEILSLLIFGSGSQTVLGALGGSRFASFLSNLFIKDLFAQMGIKLDTLSLITNGDRVGFEVGKRLSDRITVVYKNDEISTLIIRYRISDHIESEAIFGPDRSGIHIFYRNLK
ncbi:MAG: hypothetical protein C6H99_05705 [Epsilonproteobacteria bacterium]|nr:hypothetical protein [Campylobacterota bacterium]NPA64272.1 hypothetical protein [Campylobacterota bacterium]